MPRTDEEWAAFVFANCVRRARHGNKKRRKAKTKGGFLTFHCPCCDPYPDRRRALLDEIHTQEMTDYDL